MRYRITMDDGSEYLMHHGVKGMKWGVWNAETKAKYGMNGAEGAGGGGGGGLDEEDLDDEFDPFTDDFDAEKFGYENTKEGKEAALAEQGLNSNMTREEAVAAVKKQYADMLKNGDVKPDYVNSQAYRMSMEMANGLKTEKDWASDEWRVDNGIKKGTSSADAAKKVAASNKQARKNMVEAWNRQGTSKEDRRKAVRNRLSAEINDMKELNKMRKKERNQAKKETAEWKKSRGLSANASSKEMRKVASDHRKQIASTLKNKSGNSARQTMQAYQAQVRTDRQAIKNQEKYGK